MPLSPSNDTLSALQSGSPEDIELALWQQIDGASTIDALLHIIQTFGGPFPLKKVTDLGPQVMQKITVESLRKRIEQVRHGQESIGQSEPNPPLPTFRDWSAAKQFDELEETLPNFAGIREAVRKLLQTDHTYQKYTSGSKAGNPGRKYRGKAGLSLNEQMAVKEGVDAREKQKARQTAREKLEEQRKAAQAHERRLFEDRQATSRKQRLALERKRSSQNR